MPTYLSPGVYVEEVPAATRPIAGVGTAVAGFVGFAEKGPINTPTLITNWVQFTQTFGEFVDGFTLAQSVYGFLNNGGGRAYIVRIPHPGVPNDGDSPTTSLPTAVIKSADKEVGALRVSAIEAGQKVSVEVGEVTSEGTEPGTFEIKVKLGNEVAETYTGTLGGRGKTNLATQVNTQSKIIRIDALEGAAGELTGGIATGTVALKAPAGAASRAIEAAAVVGEVSERTGFAAFEAIEDITIVAAPDLVVAHRQGLIDDDGVKAVQTALIDHCENMGNRMAILDTPANLNAQSAADWRQVGTSFDSKFATTYWPWINVFDPAVGRNVEMPPSGHVAGIWCRNDDTRGVFKAPANEVVRGAVGVATSATRGETDLLNPMGVNAIKSFPGRGIRVWGARTLSSDAEWRYINVRRYFNYLEESILQGTQWCVFEPNDERLWGRVRRTISAFLVNEWRSGALFGAEANEAFFVKCDAENNTAESIDAGMVIIEVGVAPVKPAEFVVFQLSQFSGGTSVSE